MDHTTYASRLRYLDADDLDDSVLDFADLDVHGTDGDTLGELDGFLVEPTAGRVLYVVVDSGGWFTSRRLLLPVEQATLDRDARALRVNVSKQSLRGYPDFDEDRFGTYSDEEFHANHRRMGAGWTSDTMHGEPNASGDSATTYRQPDWWPADAYQAERLRPIQSQSFISSAGAGGAGAVAAAAAGERHGHGDVTHSHPGGHDTHTHDHDRELVVAKDRDDRHRDHDREHEAGHKDSDDVSPHFGGRAQPGDILGIETGGETTKVGDSAEDENKRRRAAEESRR